MKGGYERTKRLVAFLLGIAIGIGAFYVGTTRPFPPDTHGMTRCGLDGIHITLKPTKDVSQLYAFTIHEFRHAVQCADLGPLGFGIAALNDNTAEHMEIEAFATMYKFMGVDPLTCAHQTLAALELYKFNTDLEQRQMKVIAACSY